MKHDALTEEQIAEAGLLEAGVYDFTIVEAKEGKSSSGNDMFSLKLNVFDTEGAARVILDWILPAFPKKFKHLHDACGLLEVYDRKDTTPEDLVGKSGKLQIDVGKPYEDKNGITRINNTVVDYVKKGNLEEYKKSAGDVLEDDSIPFG